VLLEPARGLVLGIEAEGALAVRELLDPAARQRPPAAHRGRLAVVPELVTIGVHGWTLEAFLDALRAADVGLVLDVRQRRGLRGSEYAWANAARLQEALTAAGIEYAHRKELAPTTELRELQYSEDERQGVGKRSRVELAPAYVHRYTTEILDPLDLEPIRAELHRDRATALLCVERDPEACHRSLVAERLGSPVTHLRP
jgi:uncharacterized protein (DUF488 family)